MNPILIGAAFWILVVPPMHSVDGIPEVKMGSPYVEWKIADFFEDSAACRLYRIRRHGQYWAAWKKIYKGDRQLANQYFAVANQFNNGHCMPFEIWQKRKRKRIRTY